MTSSKIASPPGSPFHDGERAVQQRAGVRERVEARGAQFIRDHMPDQHREFFAQLPFLIVGSIDREGQPWASVLSGRPGFVTAPDARLLDVRARPLAADPLHGNLAVGKQVGLLGIEPHTRRRNRMNGLVDSLSSEGFSVRVLQSFGNCPKYIQARTAEFVDASGFAPPQPAQPVDRLDHAMRGLIASSDTLFIATAFSRQDHAAHGADVSHRGGKPGFVRVDDDRTLTIPDFVGNYFFNTLGNLTVNPIAGLLFIDFAQGHLLQLSAAVDIVWEGEEVRAFEGAQRLLRFHVREARRLEHALPLRWTEPVFSPALDSTGTWNRI